MSARVAGAGFGPVVGNYLCDTQACAPSCPREQSPWSDRNNRCLCTRVCGQRQQKLSAGVGGSRPPTTQDALFLVWPLSWGYCPTLSTAHSLPWLGHFGPVVGGLAVAMEPR